eukprot:NODE_671_length_4854_cov_0.553312.p3 type:complete len:327 gc:universal NODE_671_length_4854_cov_0.553312:883-1863(+)
MFGSSFFNAKQPMYGIDFSRKSSKIAAATSNASTENEILILDPNIDHWIEHFRIPIKYPVTNLIWSPFLGNGVPDLFATTSNGLNIYSGDHGLHRANFGSDVPLTSMDWNTVDPTLIVTSSINTTCTVWDLSVEKAKTQLIAHDKEVLDVSFCQANKDIFASCGADGSIRMFDMRSLTIIYEVPNEIPLLRVDWNPIDSNYILTVPETNNEILIIDVRYPSVPVSQIRYHSDYVNDAQWCKSSGKILSCSDDKQVLVCDLMSDPGYTQFIKNQGVVQNFPTSPSKENPMHRIECDGPVSNVCWSHNDQDTIAYIVNDQIYKANFEL